MCKILSSVMFYRFMSYKRKKHQWILSSQVEKKKVAIG